MSFYHFLVLIDLLELLFCSGSQPQIFKEFSFVERGVWQWLYNTSKASGNN